jgi:hypothetical protein
LQSSPNSAKSFPPLKAKTMSTAYSGRTAMNASAAIASPAEMSSWATSAAHERTNAAPTIASPNRSASSGWPRSKWTSRRRIPGIVTPIARPTPRP